jgi:hypothetical protein
VAVTMDNGCNFAFALAGIADFEEAYFTKTYCDSTRAVSFPLMKLLMQAVADGIDIDDESIELYLLLFH